MAAVSECTADAHIANSVEGDRISSLTVKQEEVMGASVKGNYVSASSEAQSFQQIFQYRWKYIEKPHLTSYDDSFIWAAETRHYPFN